MSKLPSGHLWRGTEVDELLQQFDAELVRDSNHLIYRFPGYEGQTVLPHTPSDWRAEQNKVSEIKRMLGLNKTVYVEGQRREKDKPMNKPDTFRFAMTDYAIPEGWHDDEEQKKIVSDDPCVECNKEYVMHHYDFIVKLYERKQIAAIPRRCVFCRGLFPRNSEHLVPSTRKHPEPVSLAFTVDAETAKELLEALDLHFDSERVA